MQSNMSRKIYIQFCCIFITFFAAQYGLFTHILRGLFHCSGPSEETLQGVGKVNHYQTTTRTHWRRVKTLGQYQVGVNLQSHAQHKLWISTWHIFSWIPQNNARLKLSCKFGESKWNPYWVTMLMSSSDSNYVANDHEDVDKYVSFAIPSWITPC